LLTRLYALLDEGKSPSFDMLRLDLDDDPLARKANELRDIGERNPDRAGTLRELLRRFAERRVRPELEEIKNQLHAARDPRVAMEKLRQLHNRTVELGPDTLPNERVRS
jgi:hypothetical protein